ncbi:hypothetical protein HZS_8011 [Henneguya salminicola]|nr:hypothetical protein HZS_8011 [Henneguya salminicola]
MEMPHKNMPRHKANNRDKNLILNNATVHDPTSNPEDLSKKGIISDARIKSLQRKVQMIRQRINFLHTISSDAAHIIIPEQYKISFRNEIFLLYDAIENEGEKFILFASPRQLNILSPSSPIYFYSTFKSVAEIFTSYFLFTENIKKY